ncbi:MAG: DUF2460 domain-containing protein [Alphaproteobacteria bacterium]
MPEPVFPTLPGLAWPVTRTIVQATRTQHSISRRETKLLDQLYPIWEWTLAIEFLRDLNAEMRLLAGFYLARHGSFEPFLFADPTDFITGNETLGTGNGVKTTFQLVRSFGEYVEPITAPNVVTIKQDGVVTSAGLYSVNAGTGVVTFSSAPANGVIVTADFTYYFRCRFVDDTIDFENFMHQLWEAKQVKFRSALL